jgi:hypothetical protein
LNSPGRVPLSVTLHKKVDESRLSNKQKASGLSMSGREGPANSFIKEMGVPGIMEKNRMNKEFLNQ